MENDLHAFVKDGLLYCKIFNNILVSCHLVESSTLRPQLWHQRMSPDMTKFPMRRTVPIGNPCSMSWVQSSVMSDYLWPHGLQHARPPGPSPTPGVYSHVCPLSWWCHPTILSSAFHLSSFQSFPASGSFQMNQFFPSGGQSIGVSTSASALPMNIQDWSPLEWLVGSPCSPRDAQESSPTPQFKSINSSALSFLHSPTLISIHDHWKNHSLD